MHGLYKRIQPSPFAQLKRTLPEHIIATSAVFLLTFVSPFLQHGHSKQSCDTIPVDYRVSRIIEFSWLSEDASIETLLLKHCTEKCKFLPNLFAQVLHKFLIFHNFMLTTVGGFEIILFFFLLLLLFCMF